MQDFRIVMLCIVSVLCASSVARAQMGRHDKLNKKERKEFKQAQQGRGAVNPTPSMSGFSGASGGGASRQTQGMGTIPAQRANQMSSMIPVDRPNQRPNRGVGQGQTQLTDYVRPNRPGER